MTRDDRRSEEDNPQSSSTEPDFLRGATWTALDQWLLEPGPVSDRTPLATADRRTTEMAGRFRRTIRALRQIDDPAVAAQLLHRISAQIDGMPETRGIRRDVSHSVSRNVAVARTSTPQIARKLIAGVGLAVALGVLAVIRLGSPFQAQQGHVASYHTAQGQRATVRLADGTVVTLSPATSVTVAPSVVTVDGEASFIVAAHPDHPFVVRTSNAVVQVLGTSFMVRRYSAEHTTRVLVEDGKVSVHAKSVANAQNSSVVLTAHMLAQVSDSNIAIVSGISTDSDTTGINGKLVFDHTPLGTMVSQLGKVYGVEIHVSDTTLASQPLRLNVSVTEDSLTQVLERICKVTDAHYVHRGGAYVLSPGRVAGQGTPARPRHHSIPQPEQQYGL